MRSWLLTWLGVSIALGAAGQYQVRHYTIKDGLAQGGAYYMLKDSRRYLWFLSQDGLTRFDGTRFVNYYSSKTDPGSGPTGDSGSGLAETPNGDLWFGTEQCLNHYHRATNRFSTVFTHDKRGKPLSTLTHVIGSIDDRVWFINEAEGLLSLDWRTGRRTLHTSEFKYNPPFDNEYAKLRPGTSEIWILLPDNGVAVYDYRTKQTRSFFSNRSDNQIGSVRSLASLYSAPDGTVWLIDDKANELVALNPASKEILTYHLPKSLGSGVVGAIEPDQQGQLLLATGGDGVYTFNLQRRSWVGHLQHDPLDQNSLATNAVSELLVDPEGILWINADPVGLDQCTPDTYQVHHYDVNPIRPTSLHGHNVWQVAERPDGLLWVGLYMSGMDLLDPKQHRVIRHFRESAVGRDSLPSNTIYCLKVDKQGRTWATAGVTFCRYDDQRKAFIALRPTRSDTLLGDHRIVAMCDAPNGTFFVATWGGLYTYDPSTNHMTLLADAGVRFNRTIYYDPRTQCLYASRRLRDVVCYKVNGKSVQRRFSALATSNSQAIVPDSDSTRLWVATTNGLFMIRAKDGKTLRSWSKNEGLPHNVTYSALSDQQGMRWISTNRGLAVIEPQTGHVRVARSIEPTEFNNASFLYSRSGEMYFGSTTGLYRFDPLRQTPLRHALSVNLTGLLINDQPAQPDSSLTELNQIELLPDQRTLTLQFGVIDYFSHGQNQYRYRLVGYDDNWINSGQNGIARYANLPPATYIFEILAADAEGRWMNHPRQTTVTVLPPFWRTTWFLLFVLTLVGTAGYIGFQTYLRGRLRRQRREFQLQTASQQAERERLARDLHDHIGPDLVSLKLQLEVIREDVTNTLVEQPLGRVIDQASRIVTDVRQVSHALMPTILQQKGLVFSLNEYIEQLNRQAPNCEISFTHSPIGSLGERPQQTLLQIAKELTSNAFRHAHASLIDVELYEVGSSLELTVSDNGRGYDPAVSRLYSGGIGLRNIRAIVEQSKGQFTIIRKPTGGMQHRIALPLIR